MQSQPLTVILASLASAVGAEGGIRAFARRHDFAPGFVSQVLNERTPPSDRICRTVGYTRVVRYERIARRSK